MALNDYRDNDSTTLFDIRKPRLYHNLNWDIISGEHVSLKGREISEELMDTMNLGYRLPQDLYEDITITSYLLALERGRGITSIRESEIEEAENSLIERFNLVITWKNNKPIPGYKPKIPLAFRLLGNPFQTKPGLTIPRLKPEIQLNDVALEKESDITRTEKVKDIFHRYEQEIIKPHYYPMCWVRDNRGILHLKCSKIM